MDAIFPEVIIVPLEIESSSLPVQDSSNVIFEQRLVLYAAAFSQLDDESKAGECVWVPIDRPTQIWPDEETKRKYQMLTKDGSASFLDA